MSLNQRAMVKHRSVAKGAAERCDKAARDAGQGYAPGTGYDEQLNVVISKPLNVQRATIRHITKTEPGLSEAVVTGQLVNKLLKRASLFCLNRREAKIRQALELDPTLDRNKAVARLNELALSGLPAWVSAAFWSSEIDPILLVGATSANQEFKDVLARLQSLYPALLPSEIRKRHAQYRSGSCDLPAMHTGTAWPPKADRMLRDAVALELKAEKEAVRRAAKHYAEVRVKAIEHRMRVIRRRFATTCHGEHTSWPSEVDTRLLEASTTDLEPIIQTIAAEYGRSRESVYKHCDQLGIPRQPRRAVKPWTAADLRYLTDYANDRTVRGIAGALGRSRWAVIRKLQQFGLRTAVGKESTDCYSLRDLRRGLHVRHSRLVRWIADGSLKVAVTKTKLKKGRQQRVKAKDLIHFLESHLEELNLTKIDPESSIGAIVHGVAKRSAGLEADSKV